MNPDRIAEAGTKSREEILEDLKDTVIKVDEVSGLNYTVEKDPFARFDVEESIMQCWGILEDLQLVIELGGGQTKYLKGMKHIYELKFEKLWRDFEKSI